MAREVVQFAAVGIVLNGMAGKLPASPARRWFRFGLAGVDLVAGPRLEH